MVHENKTFVHIVYNLYACIYKQASSASVSVPVEPLTRKKKPFCRGPRIVYKYSDRSSGPLRGKVTHTFLLINSPCRLADHSSVLSLIASHMGRSFTSAIVLPV